ncbi:hypothetical protein HH308_21795 [Gordonia sp. TBRC 11910]|uniref:Uncharacterized protein n=1 Tax=Gordonia asplenii TaxID=2725283 RepID=A0A848KYS4_9ACTN|nr:DUF5682 family protein [Gordonia asplenii]NMO03850.1 hypothetical protein [Gordonia asplenii]
MASTPPRRTSQEIRAVAERLVTDDYVIIPVRHHSPACAYAVARAVETYSPAAILVEGPRSFTPLVGALTDERAQAPLAVYTYSQAASSVTAAAAQATAAQATAAYYPFCDFSPELVALREAAARGIPASFIDLEFTEQRAADKARRDRETDGPQPVLDESRLHFSRRLGRLAEELGCTDTDDLWEHLFELADPGEPLHEHLARLTSYCLMARDDTSATDRKRDGTAAREAEMTWHIGQAIDTPGRSGPVLVVVGGFHAVALPDLLDAPPPRPSITAPQASSALIRFSFQQVDAVNGYAAGITAPGWQQRIWTGLHAANPKYRTDAALDLLIDVATELRERGRPIAEPTVADAYVHAHRLATLRERRAPLRSDVLDGVRATFIKGDVDVEGGAVLAAALAAFTGDRIGRVPPGVPSPPLVADALDRLRAQRLHVDEPIPGEVTLAIYRRPAHRTTSRLLHGLVLLDVPFAHLVRGPDFAAGVGADSQRAGLHLITETWIYRWSPGTESALVEASRYGNTLPDAVGARFDEILRRFADGAQRQQSDVAAGLVVDCCRLGLHPMAGRAAAAADAAIAADQSFVGVAAACAQLTLLTQAREPLEANRVHELPALISAALRRARYLGRLLPPDDPRGVVDALQQLRLTVLDPHLHDAADHAAGFTELLQSLDAEHPSPTVRGGAAGMLFTIGEVSAADLAARTRGMLTGTVPASQAVAFLTGLMRTAREFTWQDTDLVDMLGELFTSWTDDEFTAALPDLRLAFAELTPAETDLVAAVVARRLDVRDATDVTRPDGPARPGVDANRATSEEAAEILAAQGLSEWLR